MKKKNILIGILIIGVLFGAFNFIKDKAEKKRVDDSFISCLSWSNCGFSMNYKDMNESERDYYFTRAASNLWAADIINPYTSYKEMSDNAQNPLGRLYSFMTVNNSTANNEIRVKLIEEKGHDIYRAISKLSMEPENEENWAELSKIVNELGF